MKLGSCIHLEELRSTLCSILRLDLLFTVQQKRDICTAFPAAALSLSLLSSSAAA